MTVEGPLGICVVDKAAGPTSHDVVARARRVLGARRVGHAGTLDPDATGVLVLGVGRATRLLRYLSPLAKSYRGEVVLGEETTTLDDSGEVVASFDMAGVTLDAARQAAAALVGAIEQVPPMVSAVKVGGRRLHQLARQGIEVDRASRPVTVYRFEVGDGLVEQGQLVLRVEVDCSSGTYVRVLASDLGRALGGGAHLRHLRRTAVGQFTLARARPLEDAELLPPVDAVSHLATVQVDDDVAALVATGTRLARAGQAVTFDGDGPWAVTSASSGELLAVYEAMGTRAHPRVVLAQPSSGKGR